DGARTPIITAWNRVGVDLQKFQASVVDSILAAGVMPGSQRRIGFERAVGATGVDRAERARHDPAVPFYAAPYRDHRRVRGIARGQFLGVIHDDLHRSTGFPREKISDGQIDTVAFATKLT